MTAAETTNMVGRLLVAAYFVWAAMFNIRTWDTNVSEFRRIGMPAGAAALSVGLVFQTVGSALFLYGDTVVAGAALLILFTLTADLLFHRYWTYADAKDRVTHQLFLCEHMALIGGIIGLAAPYW